MEQGTKVEVLVAVSGAARWMPAVVLSTFKVGRGFEERTRYNVRGEDGRYRHGCASISLREVRS